MIIEKVNAEEGSHKYLILWARYPEAAIRCFSKSKAAFHWN